MELLAKQSHVSENEPCLDPAGVPGEDIRYTRYVGRCGWDHNDRTQIMWVENYQLTILHSHSLLYAHSTGTDTTQLLLWG